MYNWSHGINLCGSRRFDDAGANDLGLRYPLAQWRLSSVTAPAKAK
jgi:hypothetical protein